MQWRDASLSSCELLKGRAWKSDKKSTMGMVWTILVRSLRHKIPCELRRRYVSCWWWLLEQFDIMGIRCRRDGKKCKGFPMAEGCPHVSVQQDTARQEWLLTRTIVPRTRNSYLAFNRCALTDAVPPLELCRRHLRGKRSNQDNSWRNGFNPCSAEVCWNMFASRVRKISFNCTKWSSPLKITHSSQRQKEPPKKDRRALPHQWCRQAVTVLTSRSFKFPACWLHPKLYICSLSITQIVAQPMEHQLEIARGSQLTAAFTSSEHLICSM